MIFRLIILQAIFFVLLFPISVNSQSVWQRIEDYDDIDNAKWIESTDQYIYALHEVQDGSLGPVVQVLTQWSLNGNLNWRKYFEIEYGNVWNGP